MADRGAVLFGLAHRTALDLEAAALAAERRHAVVSVAASMPGNRRQLLLEAIVEDAPRIGVRVLRVDGSDIRMFIRFAVLIPVSSV